MQAPRHIVKWDLMSQGFVYVHVNQVMIGMYMYVRVYLCVCLCMCVYICMYVYYYVCY